MECRAGSKARTTNRSVCFPTASPAESQACQTTAKSLKWLALPTGFEHYEKGETAGFMKLLVDAETKLILGATFLGTGGDEAIHCVLHIMYAKAPYTVLQRAVHIHPTVAEFIPTILGNLVPLSG